ncbi:MAG: hypothetical protein KGS72_00095 [Cyanobacteria bacterium REEB67]|nr:hypothetical protein [Cyanobacteria bacterium REEB67]
MPQSEQFGPTPDLTPQARHDAEVIQIGSHAEQIFNQSPDGYKDVFKDLEKLRKEDTPEQFAKDLEAINQRLHLDGWLPNMEIVMTPKGGFMLRRQSDSEWKQEAQQRQQQYNDRSYAAPAPAASPGGYNSGYSPSEGASGRGGYAPRQRYNPEQRGNPGNFRYNPRVSGDAAKRIMAAAHSDIGQPMWRETNHGASGAREGCAASVSSVLRQAGVSNVHEMECHRLQAALQQEGWTVSHTPSPGDVVFGYGGLSRAHVGIVGENGTAMDNHSSTGQWSSDSLSYFGRWNETVFLHPPQAKDQPDTPAPTPAAHTPAPAPAG